MASKELGQAKINPILYLQTLQNESIKEKQQKLELEKQSNVISITINVDEDGQDRTLKDIASDIIKEIKQTPPRNMQESPETIK